MKNNSSRRRITVATRINCSKPIFLAEIILPYI
jgi:hypothetical protein